MNSSVDFALREVVRDELRSVVRELSEEHTVPLPPSTHFLSSRRSPGSRGRVLEGNPNASTKRNPTRLPISSLR